LAKRGDSLSSKLVVEFYDSKKSAVPVACVLECHGEDNPSSAATTLNDFFATISGLTDRRFDEASTLAARFVVWQSAIGSGISPVDFNDVGIISFQEDYGFQIARVYAQKDRPHVEFVRDAWTTDHELYEAALILGSSY
jgi:hypothetical protein